MPEQDSVLARAEGENFTVASRLLPRDAREHLMAIYGFARLVDDIGDEPPGDRLAAARLVEPELGASTRAGARPPGMRSLAATVRASRAAARSRFAA